MSAPQNETYPRGERIGSTSWEETTSWAAIGPTGLERFWEVLKRRKAWVISSILLMTLMVVVLTSQQTKLYTSSASLLFLNSGASALNSSTVVDPARQGATNESLVVLPAVAQRAARIAGNGISSGEISAAVNVSPSNDSDVIKIEATSANPRRAALIANAYGRGYIAFRASLDQAQLASAAKAISDRLDALPASERTTTSLGLSLRSQLDQLTQAQAQAGSSAQLVEQAEIPFAPSSPKVKRNVILALLLGTIIGVGLAFLRDRFDQSLRTTEELEAIYGVPLLASISRARTRAGEAPATDLNLADMEAFRTLRANLRYFGVSRELRSLLVSSPTAGDGKSTVAMNLATTMAEMGDRVVLVEADLHKPSAMALDGRKPKPGLSSALSGLPLDKALSIIPITDPRGSTPARELALLPPGPLPPNPSELLESKRMLELLDELEDRFERVIIDSPALIVVSDMRALVGCVSGVLIVSAINHTRRSAAEDFRRQIELLGGHPLGIVANRVSAPRYGGDEYYRNS